MDLGVSGNSPVNWDKGWALMNFFYGIHIFHQFCLLQIIINGGPRAHARKREYTSNGSYWKS